MSFVARALGAKQPAESGPEDDSRTATTNPVPAADPVPRRLLITTFAVVVLWLAGLLGFLSTGQINPAAPRTSAERALSVYEVEIKAKTMTTEKWADYITVLVSSGQFRRAEDTINSILGSIKDEPSLILLERARLDFARKDYEAAVKSADEAIVQARKDYEAAQKKEAARGFSSGELRLPQEETAVLLKAEAYQAAGAPKKAIAAFDTYLEYQPTAANVFVERADMKAAIGDKAGAEADYRKALTFTPEDIRALEGLKKIGVES